MFLTSRPDESAVRKFLTGQVDSRFSYPYPGTTIRAEAPQGYVIDHERVLLGHGEEAWQFATEAIRAWTMFAMPWLQLCWPDASIAEGTNVAVLIRHYGFWSLNASRIVYTVNETSGASRRFGFAYGTLQEHGERGEERFLVEWQGTDNSVWYDLFAFSRPHAKMAWLGYPLVRRLQRRFRRDSLAAMLNAVHTSEPR